MRGEASSKVDGWLRSASERRNQPWDERKRRWRPVHYAVVEGLSVLEGDILLGTAELVEARARAIEAHGGPTAQQVDALGVGTMFPYRHWPGNLVPYVIDPELEQPERVHDAIAHWQRYTPIRFVVRTRENAALHPGYLLFKANGGYNSWLGRNGGEQIVGLANGCSTGAAIHEIGYAIGLHHEQDREDRDQYVRILWANILPGYEHAFAQYTYDADDLLAYD